MGWMWGDKSSDSSSDSSGDLRSSRRSLPSAEEDYQDRRSTRKVSRSKCRTEEVEPGRFVRRCEKTEQILRECVGRPAEVIESNTEHTEEYVTDEMTNGTIFFGSSSGMDAFSFPGLRSDIEAIERGVLGGLDTFIQAAEDIKREFFESFDDSPTHRETPPFTRQVPFEEDRGRGFPEQEKSSAFDEFAGKVRDV